jgi:hypothetical protein
MEPSLTVYCRDALTWLAEHSPLLGCSVVTSLPDASSFPTMSLETWKAWFVDSAEAVLKATPDDGVALFYQTDIKHGGEWVDKAFLCQKGAERAKSTLLWHKIVCRKPPGSAGFGRPAYSHLLCFSRSVREQATYPDVLPTTGAMTWSQAMGLAACDLACRYIKEHTQSSTLVDPFCGVGTVLAVANQFGLHAVGVEISARRARKARSLVLPPQTSTLPKSDRVKA